MTTTKRPAAVPGRETGYAGLGAREGSARGEGNIEGRLSCLRSNRPGLHTIERPTRSQPEPQIARRATNELDSRRFATR